MITGSCHCAALRIEIPTIPTEITNCNCSICRRLGALWAYFPAQAVVVHGHPGNTDDYVQGDRTLRIVRCRTCGCVSHWEPLEVSETSRFGVNLRNFEPALLQSARIRLLDGATTWTSVPAADLIGPGPRVNRPWHEACPMPSHATLEQRVAWHRAHALACACRPVPDSILELIAKS